MMWATEGWKCSTNLGLSLLSAIYSFVKQRQTVKFVGHQHANAGSPNTFFR